jgi:hypothetical protein
METSTVQAFKLAIVSTTGLSKDALHVYVGLALFLLAVILVRGKRSLVLPWCAALLAALMAEALDLKDDIASLGHWRWAASLHDVLNTLFWPTVLTVLGHFGVIRWGKK